MNLRRFLTTATLLTVTAAASAQVAYDIQVVAMEGDVIGGTLVEGISAVRINDNGDYAFSGYHIANTGNSRSTIWNTTSVLAIEGATFGGAILPAFVQGSMQLNNNGEVAVAGVYGDPAVAAIYTTNGPVGLPGSQIDGVTIASAPETAFALADDGTVTFVADIQNGAGTVPAILNSNSVLLTQGDTIGTAVANDIDLDGVEHRLYIDSNGTPYFMNGTNLAGLPEIMDGNGIAFAEDGVIDGVGIDYINTGTAGMRANDNGDILFAGTVDGIDGLHAADGPVIQEDSSIDGNFVDFVFWCVWNNDRTAATIADLNGYSHSGLVTSDTVILRSDDSINGMPIQWFDYNLDINNNGEIAFKVTVLDTTGDYIDLALLATPVAPCEGDTDGDNDVDLNDLALLLSQFGKSGDLAGDVDGDGEVDLSDLATILGRFGRSC